MHWSIIPHNHAGIITASRQITAEEWGDAISTLLEEAVSVSGALYTFVTPPGTWHRDRF